VYETADSFVVQIEIPGVDEDDVEIKVDGHELEVRGERRPDACGKPESFYRMERSHGCFVRQFRLTQEVDSERVTATFRDGLLRLELSKMPRERRTGSAANARYGAPKGGPAGDG
jgi:HSP20 family protein